MARHTHVLAMIVGAFLMTLSIVLAMNLQMTVFLMLPPLYACFLAFSFPIKVGIISTLLSGAALVLILDPLHAVLYTLSGGIFGLVVYVLSYKAKRIEVVVVAMGTYMSALYMAYMMIARDLLGLDVYAAIKINLIQSFGAELSSMGINVSDLFEQMSALSLSGMFFVGGLMALWALYFGARLAASRGIPVLVPSFLNYRLTELTMIPVATLFLLLYLLTNLMGGNFGQMAVVLIFILLFLFFLQGISFLAWWRAKRGKSNRIFYALAPLLFLIPMGQLSLGFLGFIENMTHMRRIGG